MYHHQIELGFLIACMIVFPAICFMWSTNGFLNTMIKVLLFLLTLVCAYLLACDLQMIKS